MSPGERRWALGWLALTTVALAVVAAVLVPWDWTPGSDLGPVERTAGLPGDVLERIDAYSDRATSYGLTATSCKYVIGV